MEFVGWFLGMSRFSHIVPRSYDTVAKRRKEPTKMVGKEGCSKKKKGTRAILVVHGANPP